MNDEIEALAKEYKEKYDLSDSLANETAFFVWRGRLEENEVESFIEAFKEL